jgi:hypothetical protein
MRIDLAIAASLAEFFRNVMRKRLNPGRESTVLDAPQSELPGADALRLAAPFCF